jgi:hypothetical protein
MPYLPHPNPLLSPAIPAPDVTRPRNREGDLAASAFVTVVSDALRRGITAKFFATLGAEWELRTDLQAVCREAKRYDLRVEHLIVAFKDAWRTLPEARTLGQGPQGQEFLSRVITLCIAEFYSSRAD